MKYKDFFVAAFRALVLSALIYACSGDNGFKPRTALDAVKAGCAAAGLDLDGCADLLVREIEKAKAKKAAEAPAAPIETEAPYTDGGV